MSGSAWWIAPRARLPFAAALLTVGVAIAVRYLTGSHGLALRRVSGSRRR